MARFLLLLSVIVSVMLCAAETVASNYYVSVSGSDGNNGTSPATAWRTIQWAADGVSASDTVYDGSVLNMLTQLKQQTMRNTSRAIRESAERFATE